MIYIHIFVNIVLLLLFDYICLSFSLYSSPAAELFPVFCTSLSLLFPIQPALFLLSYFPIHSLIRLQQSDPSGLRPEDGVCQTFKFLLHAKTSCFQAARRTVFFHVVRLPVSGAGERHFRHHAGHFDGVVLLRSADQADLCRRGRRGTDRRHKSVPEVRAT